VHVWNVLHAAGWKYRTQNLRQTTPPARHNTTLSGYIFATKARLASLGHPSKFQRVLRIGLVTALKSLLPPNGILPVAKFTLRPNLALSYRPIGSVTARHSGSRRQPKFCGIEQRAPPILDRAAITLGIDPHCSWFYFPKCLHLKCPKNVKILFWLGFVTAHVSTHWNLLVKWHCICPVGSLHGLSHTLVYWSIHQPNAINTRLQPLTVQLRDLVRRLWYVTTLSGKESLVTVTYSTPDSIGPVSDIRISLCYFYFRWKGICCLQIYNRLI